MWKNSQLIVSVKPVKIEQNTEELSCARKFELTYV